MTEHDIARPRGKRGRQLARLFFGFGAGILWLGVALLAGELVLRLQEQRRVRSNERITAEWTRRVGLSAALHESLWDQPFWSYKKNARLEVEHEGRVCVVTTNGHGFRGPEIAVPKPDDLVRIVAVGASTTVEGWTDSSTYPARLDSLFARRFGPGRVEVVNCGVSAMRSGDELRRLPEYLSFEPDLILEYNCINDLSAIVRRMVRQSPSWHSLRERSSLLAAVSARCFVPSSQDVSGRMRRLILRNLESLGRKTEAAGTTVAFASFAVPDPELLTKEERIFLDYYVRADWEGSFVGLTTYARWVQLYNHLLRDMCRKNGWLYVPVAEHLSRDLSPFIDFCHMNDEGIARKAEIMFRHLEPWVARRLGAQETSPASPSR